MPHDTPTPADAPVRLCPLPKPSMNLIEHTRDGVPGTGRPCLTPQPGPMYWSFRCLVCSENISDHLSWWRRMRLRWAPLTASSETPVDLCVSRGVCTDEKEADGGN